MTPTSHARAALVLAALATMLASSACASEDAQTASATNSASPTGATVAPSGSPSRSVEVGAAALTADASPGAGGSEPAPSGTGPLTSTATPAPSGVLQAAVVKDIRVGAHAGFDRVVVEFAGTFGRWQVRYADAITEDPTGEPVPLQGKAFLSVVIDNATFDNIVQAEGGVPHVVYDGARRITPELTSVREVADAGDFEAVLSLGIGVSAETGIRAYRLADPSRLVIDVAH